MVILAHCESLEWESVCNRTNSFTGDADGLGETRKKELIKSGMQLGLRKEDDVFVVESP